MCSTAVAAVLPNGIDTRDLKLTPEGAQMVSTMHAKAAAGVDITVGQKKLIHKIYSDNVYDWELIVATNSQNWYEVLQKNDGSKITFEEMPYYWVNYILFAKRKADEKQVTALQIPLMWPTYFWWEQSKAPLAAGLNPFEAIKPEDMDLSIVTNIELFEATAAEQLGKSFYYSGEPDPYFGDNTNSWIGFYPIAPNYWYPGGEGWPQTYNGAETALKDGDQTKNSLIEFTSWDPEERTYQLENTLFFENGSTLNLNFNGEARMMGFVKEHYEVPFLTAPHVVYVGEEDGKTLDLDNMYESSDWGPFTKFFVLGGTGGCEAVVRNGQNVFNQDWTSAMGIARVEADSEFGYYSGYLFKPANTKATDPYGWWDMKDPNIEYNDRTGNYMGNDMEPRLNQLMPAGYNDSYMPWSSTDDGDCFYLVNEGYYTYLAPYTRFCIGDKEQGLFLYGTDNYGNTYHGSYAGNIVLHTDPKDLSKTTEIPAISDIDAVEGVAAAEGAKIIAGNGVVSVVAEEDVNVAVYNLAGACVKASDLKAGNSMVIELEDGIYVVKAGNAVKKVVL